MEVMIFKVGSWTMRIVPDKFFPVTVKDLKKLVKHLLQAEFPKDTEYIEQLTMYLKDRINFLDNEKRYYLNHYEKTTDFNSEFESFYIEKQNAAVEATIAKIESIREKIKKNLEYMESL